MLLDRAKVSVIADVSECFCQTRISTDIVNQLMPLVGLINEAGMSFFKDEQVEVDFGVPKLFMLSVLAGHLSYMMDLWSLAWLPNYHVQKRCQAASMFLQVAYLNLQQNDGHLLATETQMSFISQMIGYVWHISYLWSIFTQDENTHFVHVNYRPKYVFLSKVASPQIGCRCSKSHNIAVDKLYIWLVTCDMWLLQIIEYKYLYLHILPGLPTVIWTCVMCFWECMRNGRWLICRTKLLQTHDGCWNATSK